MNEINLNLHEGFSTIDENVVDILNKSKIGPKLIEIVND
jgi:hypothetical protein